MNSCFRIGRAFDPWTKPDYFVHNHITNKIVWTIYDIQIDLHFLGDFDLRPSINNTSTHYDSIGRPPHARHDYIWGSTMIINTLAVYQIFIQLRLLITCTINVSPTKSFIIMTMVLWYVLMGVTNTRKSEQFTIECDFLA